MKLMIASFLLIATVLLVACSYEKRLGIDMPQGFSDARKKQVLQQFADGKKAYTTHCAICHNKTVHRKEVIPDISFEQADTYRIRFANDKHKDELKTEAVTEKELDNIVIFFKYKKESGVAPF
jgi:mono/diheme cytochrome c family protein